MTVPIELRARGLLPNPSTLPASASQRQAAVSILRVRQEANSSSPIGSAAPKRTQIPERYSRLEPTRPMIAIDDDPVFNAFAARRILGVTDECLKKWRQRNQGPDYIQYGRDGAVRYALKDLMAFRAGHTLRME
jgi:hypothetical protein